MVPSTPGSTVGTPNVFFMNANANFDGNYQHFVIRPGGDYGVEDTTYGGDEDFNDIEFSLSSLNVPVLTAAADSNNTQIDLNWTVDPTAITGARKGDRSKKRGHPTFCID